MAEFTNAALQTVAAGQNVLFTDRIGRTGCNIMHRSDSGIATLRGIATNVCSAKYKVSFGGNIAIPTGGTVGAISLALAIEGEPLQSATMIATPAAVNEFANVFAASYIEVPKGCCLPVSVKNTSAQAIDVQNANLIIERIY